MVGTRLLVLAVVAVWSSQVLVTSGQASGPGSSPPRSLPTDFGFDPQSALLMDETHSLDFGILPLREKTFISLIIQKNI